MAIINGNRTLYDLRNSHNTKPSFNKAMRMDARKRYEDNGGEFHCRICGETREVDLCHIKAISEFQDNDLIKDINGPNNTVVLCPLHHRLQENGDLNIKLFIESDKFGVGMNFVFEFNKEMKYDQANLTTKKIKELILNYLKTDPEIKQLMNACSVLMNE